MPDYTWDGLPIAPDEPNGAAVTVRRDNGAGREYLILHRARQGQQEDWAWTPPAGARQPGESILGGALRELAEETGLAGVDIWPIDLADGWAGFCVDIAPDMAIRLVDVEHDRFEWVPADEAIRRCTPERVSDGIRRAERVVDRDIAFRPLTRADLPAMLCWQTAPHVAEWFQGGPTDLAAMEAKYGPRIDGVAPTSVEVAEVDGVPSGFLQRYLLRDHPEYATAMADHGAVGIDYVIGDGSLVNRGLGPRMIWQYVRDVVIPAYPDVPRVLASPDVRNARSIRALQKTGFLLGAVADVPGQPHPEQVCSLDRARVFGPRFAGDHAEKARDTP